MQGNHFGKVLNSSNHNILHHHHLLNIHQVWWMFRPPNLQNPSPNFKIHNPRFPTPGAEHHTAKWVPLDPANSVVHDHPLLDQLFCTHPMDLLKLRVLQHLPKQEGHNFLSNQCISLAWSGVVIFASSGLVMLLAPADKPCNSVTCQMEFHTHKAQSDVWIGVLCCTYVAVLEVKLLMVSFKNIIYKAKHITTLLSSLKIQNHIFEAWQLHWYWLYIGRADSNCFNSEFKIGSLN